MSLTVTSVEKLKELSKGKVVELPGWEEGVPFIARLKRPSVQVMAANGTIPNALLNAATEVFYGDARKKKDEEVADMKEMSELQMIVVKASLLEPSIEDLEEIGLELTDEQLIAIFQYSQFGVDGLKRFRKEPGRSKDNKSK